MDTLQREIFKKVENQINTFSYKICGSYLNEESGTQGTPNAIDLGISKDIEE